MKRLATLFVAVSLLCGCKAQSAPGTDPFFGRTTVPAPPTGAAVVRPSDPAPYRAPEPSNGPSVSIPQTPPPSTGSATGGAAGPARYDPPGGSFDYRGSSAAKPANTGVALPVGPPAPSPSAGSPPSVVRIVEPTGGQRSAGGTSGTFAANTDARSRAAEVAPSTPQDASPASPSVSDTGGDNTLAGRPRVVLTLPTRPKPPNAPSGDTANGAASAAESGTRNPQTPSRSIDIMDLPKADSSASSRTPASTRTAFSGETFRLVARSEQSGRQTGADNPAAEGKYGHAPDYRWLRGRLEYSQIDRRWKVRYLPTDWRPDDYGGSVVLSNTSLLSGMERGDFVEVRGRLGIARPGGSNAPVYEAAEVARLDAKVL